MEVRRNSTMHHPLHQWFEWIQIPPSLSTEELWDNKQPYMSIHVVTEYIFLDVFGGENEAQNVFF